MAAFSERAGFDSVSNDPNATHRRGVANNCEHFPGESRLSDRQFLRYDLPHQVARVPHATGGAAVGSGDVSMVDGRGEPQQHPGESLSPTSGADSPHPAPTPENRPTTRRADSHTSSYRAPESRPERLARIKAEIEAGTYDSPDKLEFALSRMIDTVVASGD